MKKLIVVTAMLGLMGAAVPVYAFGCKPSCAPAPCVQYEERVVTCYKPVWKEKQVTCTITKLVPRVVDETRTCTVLIPEMKEEKRTCTTFKLVPKEVEREITCVKLCCVEIRDPCTGCCHTTCKPEFYTKKVKQIICEAVPQDHTYTVQVCVYRPEERKYTCKVTVWDSVPQEVTRCVRYCEMVPYQVTIKVPVPCCK
jgi:hypothetical protein